MRHGGVVAHVAVLDGEELVVGVRVGEDLGGVTVMKKRARRPRLPQTGHEHGCATHLEDGGIPRDTCSAGDMVSNPCGHRG